MELIGVHRLHGSWYVFWDANASVKLFTQTLLTGCLAKYAWILCFGHSGVCTSWSQLDVSSICSLSRCSESSSQHLTSHRHVYYLSWPLGFCLSASVWIFLSMLWPPPGLGEVDEKDIFGTFGPREESSLGDIMIYQSCCEDGKGGVKDIDTDKNGSIL